MSSPYTVAIDINRVILGPGFEFQGQEMDLYMLYGDVLDHLMKQSSTRAFPNGLIPSPFARQVNIFTHWISDKLVIGACLQVFLFNISMLMLTMNLAIFKKKI